MGDYDIVSSALHPSVQEFLTPCTGDFLKTFQYTIMKTIAKGMSSVVVKAKHNSSDDGSDIKALKLFSKMQEFGGKNNKRCFEREVCILSKLDHKNIVQIIVACECPSMYVISMPYYSNGTLYDLLPSLTPEQTDTLFLQLTSAVQHIHNKHLAHRDIKPENVLISSGGDAILADFGLSFAVTSCYMPLKHRNGTRGYIAPEILSSPKNTDIDYYKCDMFSLGMVLWCMVTGHTPKPNITLYDMMWRVPRNEKPKRQGSYYHIIMRLAWTDPEPRWDCQRLILKLQETWPSSFGIDLTGYFDDIGAPETVPTPTTDETQSGENSVSTPKAAEAPSSTITDDAGKTTSSEPATKPTQLEPSSSQCHNYRQPEGESTDNLESPEPSNSAGTEPSSTLSVHNGDSALPPGATKTMFRDPSELMEALHMGACSDVDSSSGSLHQKSLT